MISRLVRSADCLAIAEIYNLGISEYGQRLGPNAARYIVGEVVVVHVDESL